MAYDAQRCLSILKQGAAAMKVVGMPEAHVLIFLRIACQEGCVISSRKLGRVCTSLMMEGYDTKGMRIKSKSCDFGPMAGFLCKDPRLQKVGAGYVDKQRKEIEHALTGDEWDTTGLWKASTEQICISPKRLDILQHWTDEEYKGARINPEAVKDDILIGTVTNPVTFDYVLRRETRNGDSVWAIYYSEKKVPRAPVVWRAAWEAVAGGCGLKPMLGLVNPFPAYARGHYKNCVIGDYDLFGVWPKKCHYDERGEDRRIAGMSRSMNPADVNKQITDWEDRRLGNISNRVHTVAQMVNSAIYCDTQGGVGGSRDVIHHSDEAGRPFIEGIDDPIIAFIPPAYIVGVESPSNHPEQWKAFFRLCDSLGYRVILNQHWKWQMQTWGLEYLGTTGDAQGWRPDRNQIERLHAGGLGKLRHPH